MRNLVIILISLFPFIGLSQQNVNGEIHPNSKMYLESGIEPFLEIHDENQPTKVAATLTTITVDHRPLNQFALNNDECRTTRMYDSPKVYFEIGDEVAFKKANRNQSNEVAANAAITPDGQKFILPIDIEDDLKLGFFNSNNQPVTPLRTISDDFITIRVYESPKVYYEIKVPADAGRRLYTIHHQHR